jgi:opacity protein-like surface antigen
MMKRETQTIKLALVCAFALSLLLSTQAANATNVLTADRVGSKPPNSAVANVPVEKGKRPGLLFHFQCVDQMTLQNPTNVCFPIQSAASTSVQVKIGNAVPISCGTVAGAPGTCSYSFVDVFQNSNTCGPAANQPCVDTVKIVYNGDFPGFTVVQYSASGVKGINGENENLANLVSFSTMNDTAPTVSLGLVFDISGSMALPTISGGTLSRMQALKDATQVLLAPGGIINSYALPGDKLGVAFFSTNANPDPSTCSGTNLVGADDPTHVNTISTLIQSQNPTFSTSIGAGLQSANLCGFVNEPAPQNANKQILLFSDGAQNTFPNVVFPVVGNTVQIVDSLNSVTNYPANIHICPVTAGPLVAPALDLQQQIANASCSGRNAHSPNSNQTFTAAYLETYFAQSLAAILPTDKLEIVADTTGTLVRGSNAVEKFLGSANDVKMTIILSWSGGSDGERILPFQVKAPGGTVIDLTNRTTFAHNVSFTTLSFPLFQSASELGHKGEWQVTINAATVHSPSVNYHLLVMADNPTLVSDFSLVAQDVGTGEPIPVRVKLTDNGAPVLNATVQVQMMGPSNSQGNVLSNIPTPAPTGPGPDPAPTKGQAKLDSIYDSPANASLFADKSLPTITLLDLANTGDYTGSFTSTFNEGHYYFTVRVRGKSGEAGDVQRAFWLVRFVRSKPDPTNTVFRLHSYLPQANGTVLVTLQAIPHDALGNFLGPGYEKDMQIKSSEGSIENPLDDKLDGSYEITYRLPSASSNPTFNIQIIGATVNSSTLHQLQSQTSAHGKLALFFDAGGNFPNGAFGSAFSPGFSFNAGLEYIATSHFSAEGIFSYHRFPAQAGNALDLYQFSANGKAYLTSSGSLRPFVNAGIGGYKFSPGSSYVGWNFGAGLLYNLTPHWGLRGSYNFHAVNTPGAVTEFSTIQAGIRYVF